MKGRKGNRKGGRSRKRGGTATRSFNGGVGSDNKLIVPFNDVLTFTWVASTTPKTVTFNSDITVRSSAISALFVNYKILKVELELMPYTDSTTTSNQVVMSYYPNVGVSVPGSYNQVAEQGNGIVHSTIETVPTKYIIPGSVIAADNAMKWLPCNSSTLYTNNFGYIVAIPYGSATATLLCKMRVLMQFAYPTNSSVEKFIPMDQFRSLALKQEQERKYEVGRGSPPPKSQ